MTAPGQLGSMRIVTGESRGARGSQHQSPSRALARLGGATSNSLPHFVLLVCHSPVHRRCHSYWYDEILSVADYGSNHARLAGALKSLAAQSAHPPLYHAILFYWRKQFGDGETATRTLSNLYIAGATLCLYLLAFRLFGRRVAIATALLFAFSYTATYYGLEVRSYPQSLFLVTLSSLLLWRWLDRTRLRHPGGRYSLATRHCSSAISPCCSRIIPMRCS